MTMVTLQTIRKRVNELLEHPRFRDVYPVRLIDIANHLGYQVFYFEKGEGTEGVSGAVNHKKKIIFLNEDESNKRKMFTLAHEIGHIMLHGTKEDVVDYRSTIHSPNSRKEKEANVFAADLLMPEREFRQKWYDFFDEATGIDGVTQQLSDYFIASTTAVAIRAKQLGLIYGWDL